jgi:hypothetical protein
MLSSKAPPAAAPAGSALSPVCRARSRCKPSPEPAASALARPTRSPSGQADSTATMALNTVDRKTAHAPQGGGWGSIRPTTALPRPVTAVPGKAPSRTDSRPGQARPSPVGPGRSAANCQSDRQHNDQTTLGQVPRAVAAGVVSLLLPARRNPHSEEEVPEKGALASQPTGRPRPAREFSTLPSPGGNLTARTRAIRVQHSKGK